MPMKRVLLLIMVFPLCLMLFNNSAFRHQHILPDGQLIEHAHPFQSDSEKSGPGHHHTKQEFILFMVISDSPAILMFGGLLLAVFRILENDLKVLQPGTFFPVHAVLSKLLRAPPAIY